MTDPTHIPRGFMCCECKHALRKCNQLDFTKMQVIGTFKDDGTREVRCNEFYKRTKDKEILIELN